MPSIFYVPPKFCCVLNVFIKTYNNKKTCSPQMHISSPNLKAWLRACRRVGRNGHLTHPWKLGLRTKNIWKSEVSILIPIKWFKCVFPDMAVDLRYVCQVMQWGNECWLRWDTLFYTLWKKARSESVAMLPLPQIWKICYNVRFGLWPMCLSEYFNQATLM